MGRSASHHRKRPARTVGLRLLERAGPGYRSQVGSPPGPNRSCMGSVCRLSTACWRDTERTHRNPMFLFWFSGSFLFRFAERRFLGSFKKEPPRSSSADVTDMVRIGHAIPTRYPVGNFGQKIAHLCHTTRGTVSWPRYSDPKRRRQPPS